MCGVLKGQCRKTVQEEVPCVSAVVGEVRWGWDLPDACGDSAVIRDFDKAVSVVGARENGRRSWR